MKKRIVLLIGGGSRVPAILDAINHGEINGRIVFCLTHKKKSPGLELLASYGIPIKKEVLSEWTRKTGLGRFDYDSHIAKLVLKYEPDLIVAAGWDLILSRNFLKHFPDKIINLHPSLLPDDPDDKAVTLDSGEKIPILRGELSRVIENVFRYGLRTTGATVHFMTEEVDKGKVIIKKEVPVLRRDTSETLAERIHKAEDVILPEAMKTICADKKK